MKHFSVNLLRTAILALAVADISVAHEIQDGFVERAVQIVIREQAATITYSFGLNDNTMRQIQSEWSRDVPEARNRSDGVEWASNPSAGYLAAEPFDQAALAHLAGSLEIEIDGKPILPSAVSIEPSARHHFSFVAQLKFELPDRKLQKLTIVDGNFQNLNGAARYALKVDGSGMLLKSSVAPIIVRATRHDLSPLELENRKKICTVNATIAAMPSDSKGD